MASAAHTPERARYRVPDAEKVREHAFGIDEDEVLDEFSSVGLDQTGWVRRQHFPEIPVQLRGVPLEDCQVRHVDVRGGHHEARGPSVALRPEAHL